MHVHILTRNYFNVKMFSLIVKGSPLAKWFSHGLAKKYSLTPSQMLGFWDILVVLAQSNICTRNVLGALSHK